MDYEKFNFRERYNEVMYDERDIIQRFLEKQYDIRYGRQRDIWYFEDEIEVVSKQGSLVKITEIILDKDCFVKFHVAAFGHDYSWWECFDFAYGELSKVIDALPNAEDIVLDNAVNDLKVMTTNLRIDYLLADAPFKYEVNGKFYTLDDVKCVNGTLSLVQTLGNDTPVSDVPTEVLVNLRDHINIEVLHRSKEYKELMELLSLEENLRFECQNYGDATFVIDGTDMTFDVSSVRRNDSGGLVIYGNDIDANACDNIELTEKDIKHEYLVSIIKEMKRSKYCDIMDTYNGHNEDLVRKINDAWKSDEYHDRFEGIVHALLERDYEEYCNKFEVPEVTTSDYAMNHAHEIMEGVCDDTDLETILMFLRYKKD